MEPALRLVFAVMMLVPAAGPAQEFLFPFVGDGVDVPFGTTDESNFSYGLHLQSDPDEKGWINTFILEHAGQQQFDVVLPTSFIAQEVAGFTFTVPEVFDIESSELNDFFDTARTMFGDNFDELFLDTLWGSDLVLGILTDPDQTITFGFERSKFFQFNERCYLEIGAGVDATYSRSDFTIAFPRVDPDRTKEGLERANRNFNLGIPVDATVNSLGFASFNDYTNSIPSSQIDLHTLELTPYFFFETGTEIDLGLPCLFDSMSPFVRVDAGYGFLGFYGDPKRGPVVELFELDDYFGAVSHGASFNVDLGARFKNEDGSAALVVGLTHDFGRRYDFFDEESVTLESDGRTYGFVTLEVKLGRLAR
ncbi:MAG: hypothetical protein AAGA96_05280 [Verrucomicrobiota bacterium]